MRQIRSADPWSSFLRPPGRSEDGHRARPDISVQAASGAEDACRRVLGRLRDARSPLSLEQLRRGTRLGLLEVADAVETLRDRGLVRVEREVDEIVRLADGPA
ncbi:hypothetical protein [Spirillospora albida]|uniref:hypothetical protein n=1 Tax=Spirillospora albida TaxID=58123 RepID=UPI0012F84360|nr:hypothetical protein [Spirillospora albida]